MTCDARNLSAETDRPRPKAWSDRTAEGSARDRFGHVHPAGSSIRRGACYYPAMAFGRKTKTAAEKTAPTRSPRKRSAPKPTPPAPPSIEPAPTLGSTDEVPAGWAARLDARPEPLAEGAGEREIVVAAEADEIEAAKVGSIENGAGVAHQHAGGHGALRLRERA